jgi:hypothetical protein
MHVCRYLYLSVAATLIVMAIAVPAEAGQPLKRGLGDFGVSQARHAVSLQPSHLGGLADFTLPHGTRHPVAMVPGLRYEHRTMIPRGICRTDVWGGF